MVVIIISSDLLFFYQYFKVVVCVLFMQPLKSLEALFFLNGPGPKFPKSLIKIVIKQEFGPALQQTLMGHGLWTTWAPPLMSQEVLLEV